MDFIRRSTRSTESSPPPLYPFYSYFSFPNFMISYVILLFSNPSLRPLCLTGLITRGSGGCCPFSKFILPSENLSFIIFAFARSIARLLLPHRTICPVWGQHQVWVDLSLHLKSINGGWELMNGNGLSHGNIPKHLSSGLWASSRSREERLWEWSVMEIHEWGRMKCSRSRLQLDFYVSVQLEWSQCTKSVSVSLLIPYLF